MHVLPDLNIGGGQTFSLATIKALSTPLFEHRVCQVRSGQEMLAAFRDASIEVRSLGIDGVLDEPRGFLRLLDLVRDWRPDVIHCGTLLRELRHVAPVSALTGTPIVLSLHGYYHLSQSSRLKAVVERPVWRLMRRRVAGVVAVSDGVRETWRDWMHGIGVPNDAFLTVPPTVDVQAFAVGRRDEERAELLSTYGLDESALLLVNVARLTPEKGHAILLEAFERVRREYADVRLMIAGDGPLHGAIREQIDAKGLSNSVFLMGSVEDVPGLLSACDLFVFSSISEAFGIAPIEAMAAGLPVVITDLPQLKRYVRDGQTGLVVRKGDPEGLAAKITRYLDDPEFATLAGRRGRALVMREFGSGRQGNAIGELYKAVAGVA